MPIETVTVRWREVTVVAKGRANRRVNQRKMAHRHTIELSRYVTPVETSNHLNQRGGTRTAIRVGTRDHGGFVMSEQAVLVGGWTAYHKLTAEDQAVFD